MGACEVMVCSEYSAAGGRFRIGFSGGSRRLTRPFRPCSRRMGGGSFSAAAGDLALEQRVALLELRRGGRGDRRRAGLAVDARMDHLVRLAGDARERGDEGAA